MHAQREESYYTLQAHRYGLNSDKLNLAEHDREHRRLLHVGRQTDMLQASAWNVIINPTKTQAPLWPDDKWTTPFSPILVHYDAAIKTIDFSPIISRSINAIGNKWVYQQTPY